MKWAFTDNLNLSNGETYILLLELLDIFYIFEVNSNFDIEISDLEINKQYKKMPEFVYQNLV